MNFFKGAPFRYLVAAFAITTALVPTSLGQTAANRPSAEAREFRIRTEPNASVWIDGVWYGKTDTEGTLQISLAPAGRRVVRVRADGFAELERPTSLTSRAEVSLPLKVTTDKAELAFQEAERLSVRDRGLAIQKYREVIRLKPAFVAAHVALARRLSEAGNAEAALAAVKDLRRISPRNAEASVIEGRVFKDSGEDDKAAAAFKRSLAESRGFQPEALTGLGLLYKEKAEALDSESDVDQEAALYEQSTRYFREAVRQLSGAPDAVVVYQLLGLNLEKQKKYKDAIAVYQEFIRRFPDSDQVPTVQSFIEQLTKQIAEDRP